MIFLNKCLIISFIAEALLGSFSAREIHGGYNDVKIRNGENVTDNTFPYMVNVRVHRVNQCGGVLVNEKWVLTAGHCGKTDLSVHYGALHLDEGVFNNTVNVIKVITHPNYILKHGGIRPKYLKLHSDLALLQLEHPLTFSKTVNRTHFPKPGSTLGQDNKTVGLTIGWGYIDNHQTNPDFLQQVSLKIYNPEYCERTFKDTAFYDRKTMFCAGNDENTKGICPGDSGDPFIINGRVWGVASYGGIPCGEEPGVYTNLIPFLNWIKKVTGVTDL